MNIKTRIKISNALKGRIPKNIDQIKGFWKGKKLSTEHIKKLSDSHKGQKAWNKGLKGWNNGHFVSEETKKKISEIHKSSGHKPPNCLLSGERSHAWKGGRKRGHYTDSKYNQWRKEVFKYDNYICWICENGGDNLQVHHLMDWFNYPKLRFVKNNGLTLCEFCHKIYTNYGNKIKK